MANSVWAYPWDLHDMGLDTVLPQLADSGIDMISIATSYHAGRFVQPSNPKRKVWFPQDGTVYYKVDAERWKGAEIAPLEADIVAHDGDYLAELVRRRDAGGPKVSCWTVCLHNTRLGMAHPDHVMRTAFGDPLYFGLCPSSPAARAYVTGMSAEVSERYRVDRIELESPDFLVFEHGFHHEKDGTGLLPEDNFLLGVCFCNHCMTRAKAARVDAEQAKADAAALLSAAFERELPEAQFPDFPAKGIEAFAGYPVLHAYLQWRREPVTSLVAGIRAATHPDTQVLLIDNVDSWWGGVDLTEAIPACDGVLKCVYWTPVDDIDAALMDVRQMAGPDRTVIAGLQMFHPEVQDSADLVARTCEAMKSADGLNYYNLGLVPLARLNWVKDAIKASSA